MKIAVTGSSGKLGRKLVERGCIALNCDILQPNDLRGLINATNPDVVVHCAALTDVAYCESHFKEAFDVNVKGTVNVFESLPKNSTFIYLSTDHIFPGENWFDAGYGEWHKPQPVNVYGYTKWGGEIVARSFPGCRSVVVRTSRGFDYEDMKPTIDALNKGEEIIITDLIKRSFMYVPHFVDALLWFIENLNKLPDVDVINISGDSVWSYYRFWTIMQKSLGLSYGTVLPRKTRLSPEEAPPRPFRAGLDVKYAKKLGVPIGSLNDAIEDLKRTMNNDSSSHRS